MGILKIKNLIHRKLILYVASRCDLCIASGMKSLEYLLMIGINKEKIQIAVDSSTSPKNYPEINIIYGKISFQKRLSGLNTSFSILY